MEWNPYDPFFYAEEVINKLSSLYNLTGNLWEAERWDRELLKRAKLFQHSPDTALLERMAIRSFDLGLFAEAKQRFHDGEKILKETGKGESIEMANMLSGLAYVYEEQGNYNRSRQLYQKAQNIFVRNQGVSDDQQRALLDYKLGLAYVALEQLDEGIDRLERARTFFENKHEPAAGLIVGHLGNAYRLKGDYVKADQLYKAGEAVMPGSLAGHRRIGKLYFRHATVALLLGNKREALDYLNRWQEIVQSDLQKDLKWGAENEKVQYLASRKVELDGMVSLQQQFAEVDGEMTELSLNAVLNMKGRALDSMAYGVQNWRFMKDDICAGVLKSKYKDSFIGWLLCRSPSPEELFNRLAFARHRITSLEHSESEKISLLPVKADEKLKLKRELYELEERLGVCPASPT